MMKGAQLQAVDYVVFSAGILVSLAVGLYYAYKERKHVSSFHYHRGGGKLSAVPVAMSMLVTFESSVFYLGYPAEVYIHGFMFWLMNISMAVAFSSLFWITIPLFYPLQVTSVYEYLQKRHDSLLIRQVAMALGTLLMVLYAGIVVFGAAVALQSVTGVSEWIYIVSMSIIAVVYTSLGGIKAVVITDVVQGVIMIVMIFIVLIYGTVRVGSISRVIEINKASGRLKMIDFDPNPLTRHTFWTLIVGGMTRFVGFGFRPPVIQRLNSTKTIKDARKVAALSIPGFVVLQSLVMVEGLVAYAYFTKKGCDPLASGQISNPNQIISYAVMDMFESIPGLTGLFLAALCSASLSTISSLLSSVSAIVSEDVIRAKWKTISDVKITNASKIIVLLCGVLCIGVGLLISNMEGPVSQITGSVLGAIDGPTTALFFMSIFLKFTTKRGILVSIAIGIILGMWLSLGFNFSPGRKITPWLPLGPTNRCINVPDVVTFANQSLSATMSPSAEASTHIDEPDTTVALKEESVLHGLDYLYSISYMYINSVVTIVSITVGILVSKLTKLDRKTAIPSYLMLSLSLRLFKCQPPIVYDEVFQDQGIVHNETLNEIGAIETDQDIKLECVLDKQS